MAQSETTFTANQVAKELTKRLGREVNAKRVRAWVRDHVAEYDDEGYTAHAYSAKVRTVIVTGMTKAATQPRAKAASKGRAKGTAKPAAKPAVAAEA